MHYLLNQFDARKVKIKIFKASILLAYNSYPSFDESFIVSQKFVIV